MRQHDMGDFQDDVLGLANDESVEEIRDRLRVEGPVPASQNQGGRFITLVRPNGQTGQIEQFQDVGEELFVGGADGQNIESPRGAVALEGVEG
jgi:hypothetical protein